MIAFRQPKVETNLNSPIFLQQMWKCKYVETSAKEGTNVNELFEELLKLETSRTLRWSTCPLSPVDLYLNFKKSRWKPQVRPTGFLQATQAVKIQFEID